MSVPNQHTEKKPYHDESVLRELYHGENLSDYEIADKFGVTRKSISYWREKHGIESKDHSRAVELGHYDGVKWRDEETLREMYCEEGLSFRQIADEFDVPHSTIQRRIEKSDIETRPKNQPIPRDELGLQFAIQTNGYAYVKEDFRKNRSVALHRLLAVAEYGFDSIKDMHIHHKNGVTWDNRAGNIEVVEPEDHPVKHSNYEKEDYKEIKRLYNEVGLSQTEIAEIYDSHQSTISEIVNEKRDIHKTE